MENPNRTLLRALFYALIMVILGYFVPLLISTGAIPLDREWWSDGYFFDIDRILGGVWLRSWVQAAAAVSNMGIFVAEMSSDSFPLHPKFFAQRSQCGTPLTGILFSASGLILLSWLSFQEIVAAENFLCCFGMIMELIAFVTLRINYPAASWPYNVPVGTTTGAILMCIPPTLCILLVLALASSKVKVISLLAVVVGLVCETLLYNSFKLHNIMFIAVINWATIIHSSSQNTPRFINKNKQISW